MRSTYPSWISGDVLIYVAKTGPDLLLARELESGLWLACLLVNKMLVSHTILSNVEY